MSSSRRPPARVSESLQRWNISPGIQCTPRPGRARRAAQLRSWHLASGLFWIMNVLIELDLYAYCPPTGHWADLESGRLLTDGHFRRHQLAPFPKLKRLMDAGGTFPTDVAVDCSHAFPQLPLQPMPTIIWYRNLYGAMFSDYARWRGPEQTFEQWYQLPHFYGLPISKQDSWALFNALWITLAPGGRVITASFDHCKSHPVEGVRRILDALGESRSDAAIAEACEASDPARIAGSDPQAMAKYKFRSGSASEYAQQLKDRDVQVAAGAPQVVMDHLSGEDTSVLCSLTVDHLIDGAERLMEKKLEPGVRRAFEQNDLIGLSHHCRNDYPDNPTCQLLGAALRFTCLLSSNTVIDAQEMYVSPDAETAFRTILYCLSQASVPGLVKALAAREAGKRHLLHERLVSAESR
jgi:hypothetical protein